MPKVSDVDWYDGDDPKRFTEVENHDESVVCDLIFYKTSSLSSVRIFI